MPRLGVSVDQVAVLRQAHIAAYPDPVEAALVAQRAGAHQIVTWLQEDRGHIVDYDIVRLKQKLSVPLNLRIANLPDLVDFAVEVKPDIVTLVAEQSEKSFGLDLSRNLESLTITVKKLSAVGIPVSLFIVPTKDNILLSQKIGAQILEFYAGSYAEELEEGDSKEEFEKIKEAAQLARQLGFVVHAGWGLHYENIAPLRNIKDIQGLNIGRSIVSRSITVGMEQAVKEMLDIL